MPKKQEELLVSREELEKMIDSLKGLEPYRDFLKSRWVGMVMWWHNRSVEARRKYFLLRAFIVVGGVLIPVLSAFSMQPGWERFFSLAIAGVGAVVAGCAAWEGVANYGETWREKRRAAELLKVEGWQFFQLCGKYQNDGSYEKAFPHFATEVENMIAKEVGEYLAAFDPSLAQARQHAATIADAIVEKVKKQL
jgi:uncharacterized protein DUF4231